MALKSQYAGDDKWESEIKIQDELLHTRVWKGQNNFSLEKFIAQHRNAFISMEQCAEHVAFQLPNERTRVAYLLDGIQCNDAPLQAAMALVRNDTGPTGKMSDFESTASHLLPHDPVSKKRAVGTKRGVAEISDTFAMEISDASMKKPSVGTTGVELRFYEREDYRKLTEAQQQELREYRDARDKRGGGKRGSKGGKPAQPKKWDKKQKKLIAAAVTKKMEEKEKEAQVDNKTGEEFKSYIMSLISGETSKVSQKATTSSTTAVAPPPTDQGYDQ